MLHSPWNHVATHIVPVRKSSVNATFLNFEILSVQTAGRGRIKRHKFKTTFVGKLAMVSLSGLRQWPFFVPYPCSQKYLGGEQLNAQTKV